MDATLHAALIRARNDPNYGFDTLRDDLNAVDVSLMPELLSAAQDPDWEDLRPQLVAALGDWGWPGAYPSFEMWVQSDNWFYVLDAACALDTAGGGGFGYWQKVAPDDAPNRERVLQHAPALLAWWQETGRAQAPDLETWKASLGRQPTREERIFILVRTSGWAVLADGSVVEDTGPLPRNAGVHYASGEIDVEGIGAVPVVFVLDSDADDPIREVMVEASHGWLNVAARATAHRPRNVIGDAPQRACRYEVGPTGSLRPKG